jgi:pentafunctional AROM polypeptide
MSTDSRSDRIAKRAKMLKEQGPSAALPAVARNDQTVVLIGMRGAGKSHLGKVVAANLGREFIDLDDSYVAKYGSIIHTAQTLGWPVFREREVEILRETLEAKPTGAVLACGGGIVETEPGRALLKAHWPVVQACKAIEDVEAYLNSDSSRPSLGEPPRSIFERRSPWYYECADFDLLAAPGEADWSAQDKRLLRLLRRAFGLEPPPSLPHAHSFVLCVSAERLEAALPLEPSTLRLCDAVELRADLLHSQATAVGCGGRHQHQSPLGVVCTPAGLGISRRLA